MGGGDYPWPKTPKGDVLVFVWRGSTPSEVSSNLGSKSATPCTSEDWILTPVSHQSHLTSDIGYSLNQMASTTAQRRLLKEYRALTNNPPEGITAGPVSEDDLLYWEALIQGPEGTPFEGGVFPAELKFPKDYPLAPPSMRFLGEVWHPNGTLSSNFTVRLIVYYLRGKIVDDEGYRNSISERSSLHKYSTSTGRRSKPLRTCVRALVTDSERGKDSYFGNEHVGGTE